MKKELPDDKEQLMNVLAGQLKPLKRNPARNSHKKQRSGDQYDIYKQSQVTPIQMHSQSSFELSDEQNVRDSRIKKNEAIQKVLSRLGLNNKPGKQKDQQLQIVVGNIVQNCVGTVDAQMNTQEYQKIYANQYKEQLNLKINKHPGSIIVSQLSELQKIEMISGQGLWGLYKLLALFCKKISLVCQAIVEHTLFQAIILLIIILNSVKMVFDDPLSAVQSDPTIQNIFLGLYTAEMVIKICALGFIIPSKSYLRDIWNILDFVIVVTSLLPMLITINFSVNALRAIRVLRPLKTITKVKALKMIVSTLFYSFSLVMDSLYILTFVMIVFAIAGTQLFSGLLKQRCIQLATGTVTDNLCMSGGCAQGFECGRGIGSPNFSINNFDTFLWSIMSVFRTLTLEGWSEIMIGLQRVYSPFSFIYSILIVFFCEYVLLNMTMAILKYKYSQVKGNSIEEQQIEKTEYQPDFLKKLGIFKQVTKMPFESSVLRSKKDKIFKGSSYFYQLNNQEEQSPVQNNGLMTKPSQRLGRKDSCKKVKKQNIDLQLLRNLGRVQQHRWDPKHLNFQSQLQSEVIAQRRPSSNYSRPSAIQAQLNKNGLPNITELQQQQSDHDDSDSQMQLDESDMSYSDQQQEAEVNDKVLALSKKLKSMKNLQDPLTNFANRLISLDDEHNQEQQKLERKNKKRNELQELDHILGIVSKDVFIEQHKKTRHLIELPQMNIINEVQAERLYQKFDDLGQYKIKRVQRRADLQFFKINRHKKVSTERKVYHGVKQIIEDNNLDIKELQLVNELSKKQMKCRIKNKEMLDQINNYDYSRVLISQKIKESEKKQKQLEENIQNMNFTVKYKMSVQNQQDQDKERNSQNNFLIRNAPKQNKGLKIPEQWWQKQNQKIAFNIKKQLQTQQNDYLKLLQNHQMEQKIELQEHRLMQIFFKKERPTKSEQEIQTSLRKEYHQIKEEDIYNRHGNITMTLPLQSRLNSQIFDSINIKPQQYQIYVKGFFGVISVIRKKLLLLITTPFYDNLMLLFVIANTATLCLNGLVDTQSEAFAMLNTTFTVAFTIDLVLKVTGYGFEFFGDIINLFDTFVVTISLVQLSIGTGGSNLSALRSIRILRAFRVLRITRLIRTLNYMKIVMSVVSSVITQFIYIFMLLGLFIFIYTLLGMQIFGGTFLPVSITGIRQNFDTFQSGIFSVFQVLTSQNWNDIQTLVMTSSTGVIGVLYLMSWIFIGNWILLNLLQAILLDGFDKDTLHEEQSEEKVRQRRDSDRPTQKQKPEQAQNNQQIVHDGVKEQQLNKDQVKSQNSEHENINFGTEDASLLIFLPSSWMRIAATKIIVSCIFENFIILLIALSSVKLVVDTYITPEQVDFKLVMDKIDIGFNCAFICESTLKIIAKGLIFGKGAYLKDNWSKLDFFIVVTAVIDMSLGIDLSILKLFRTLRPLRLISRNPDMKIIITSLAESMMGILNVLVIILMVFVMFGILGINLLQGKLNFCNPSAQLIHGFYGPYNTTQQTCQTAGGVWTTQFINFENIMNSLLSLYVFSTRQNWPYYVYTFFDAEQTGPVKNNSTLVFLIYSIVIIFICSYFFMDLLVGVLFMNFHEAQARIRPKTLTDKQINWKNLQKVIVEEDPCLSLYLKPENTFQSFFYSIVNIKGFDLFITFCILGNIIVMMVGQNDDSTNKKQILDKINLGFSIIFICQMLLKLCAFGRGYFLSGWNNFDFFVVMASILDIILGIVGADTGASSALSILPQIARIFRVLRITRLLRMFKRFKGLQKLIETFIFSMPALGKGLGIVCLFLFISSVLASTLFGDIVSDYAGNFDDISNFSNFHSSFQLLFIMTTGENWYYYLFQTITPGYVVCKQGVECVQTYFIVFWLPYVFFSQKVFMQLFVLIVLDQFQANYINQNNPLGIFALFEEDFRKNWIEHTSKYHSEKIEVKKLVSLLMALKQPLGLGKPELMAKFEQQLRENDKNTEEDIQNNLNELQSKLKKSAAKILNKMTIIKNRMYLGYHQTFYSFAKVSIVSQFFDGSTEKQKLALEEMHKESEQKLVKMRPEGNLFYFEEGQDSEYNEPLNPIELILFCQMIIKSWHNYSIKFHNDPKKMKKPRKGYEANQSLNQSCSSELAEATFEKLPPTGRRYIQRKGLIESSAGGQAQFQFRVMPDIMQHYKTEKKRVRTKLFSKRNSSINSTGKRQSKKIAQFDFKELFQKKSSQFGNENRNMQDQGRNE